MIYKTGILLLSSAIGDKDVAACIVPGTFNEHRKITREER